jgi:hypothetical protein
MRRVPALLGCAADGVASGDHFVDFNVYACDTCGLIQTDVGFDQSAYEMIHSHAVGGVWEKHRSRLAEFAAPQPTSPPADETSSRRDAPARLRRILEIGPSVHPIARALADEAATVAYIDAMAEPPFELRPGETYIAGSFPESIPRLRATASGGLFDLAIASHVAEHAPSLRAFVGGLFDLLTPAGAAVLSIPDFRAWLEGRYWNAITSEHLNYPFAEQIETLCDELDLAARFERFDGHSLFIELRRGAARDAPPAPARGSNTETRTLFTSWVRDIQTAIGRIETALLGRRGNVIVAGASHLAQYLTMMSDTVGSRARCVIDNARSKHGARLYGTNLTVAPFDILGGMTDALVVIPPSPYRDEMERQVKSLNRDAIVLS